MISGKKCSFCKIDIEIKPLESFKVSSVQGSNGGIQNKRGHKRKGHLTLDSLDAVTRFFKLGTSYLVDQAQSGKSWIC